MNKKYSVTIPKNIDPYWIGFILGDGAVVQTNKYSKALMVTLHSKDIKHLEKLQAYFQTDTPIKRLPATDRTTDRAASLRIYRTKLVNQLADYGIVPNKTFIAKVPSFLKFDRDFWRGLIDADGTICLSRQYPCIGLYGTYDICQGFIDYIKYIFGEDFTKRNVNKSKSIYRALFTKRAARKILKHLYQDGDLALDRKMVLAQKYQ